MLAENLQHTFSARASTLVLVWRHVHGGLGGHVHAAVSCIGGPVPRSRMIKSVALDCLEEPIGFRIK